MIERHFTHVWFPCLALALFVASPAVADDAAMPHKRPALPKTVDGLIPLLSSADVQTAAQAALALSDLNSPRAVGPLIDMLTHKVRQRNLWGSIALARLGCNEKVQPLIELLESKEWWHRRNAAWVLGRMECQDAAKPLIRRLNDQAWEVRMYTAWALGRLQDKEAIGALGKLAKAEKGKRDGAEAERALAAIKNGPHKVQLKKQPGWLLIYDQDIPAYALKPIRLLIVEADIANLCGFNINPAKERPLKVSFNNDPYIVCHGGEGTIEEATHFYEETQLAIPYHPDFDEG